MRLPAFVCLSVCLLARLLKTLAWIWMKCSVSTDVGTWTNWLTFEPDPDYSPDAGTGLLSPISYALQRRILLRLENPTYRYWAPVAAATRGLKMVLFTHICRMYMRSTGSECPSSFSIHLISWKLHITTGFDCYLMNLDGAVRPRCFYTTTLYVPHLLLLFVNSFYALWRSCRNSSNALVDKLFASDIYFQSV